MNSTQLLIIGFVISVAGAGAGGYYYGKGQIQIQTQEKIVYKDGETKIEYRDRIVTVTKTTQPNGTVTETTKTEEVAKNTDKKTQQVAEEKKTETTPVTSQYSLGVQYHPSYSELLGYADITKYSVVAGYRVLGPAWLEAGGGFGGLVLGIRVEL